MYQTLQILFLGLMVGCIYALVGVGYTTVYNSTKAINFAQGEFCMLGGMFAATFFSAHVPLFFAAILAFIAVTVIGIAVNFFTIRPLKEPSTLTLVVILLAVSTLLKGLVIFGFGTDPRSLPQFSSSKPILLGNIVILPQGLWIMVFSALVVFLLKWFFSKTLTGRALRATSLNRMAADLCGINSKFMVTISFAISASVGALAGVLITPITFTSFDFGSLVGLKGFVAAEVGGRSKVNGALWGGLFLGVIESLGAGFISSGFKDAIAFLILIGFLYIRPEGILGEPQESKV